MTLPSLIAWIAKAGAGQAGRYVLEGEEKIALRDRLSDALMPIAQRDVRWRALVDEVRTDLRDLPADPREADRLVECAVRDRVRRSGRCNVSRAVSDLVRAGSSGRHYQQYRVDHANRGAQREALYTLTYLAAQALTG